LQDPLGAAGTANEGSWGMTPFNGEGVNNNAPMRVGFAPENYQTTGGYALYPGTVPRAFLERRQAVRQSVLVRHFACVSGADFWPCVLLFRLHPSCVRMPTCMNWGGFVLERGRLRLHALLPPPHTLVLCLPPGSGRLPSCASGAPAPCS